MQKKMKELKPLDLAGAGEEGRTPHLLITKNNFRLLNLT